MNLQQWDWYLREQYEYLKTGQLNKENCAAAIAALTLGDCGHHVYQLLMSGKPLCAEGLAGVAVKVVEQAPEHLKKFWAFDLFASGQFGADEPWLYQVVTGDRLSHAPSLDVLAVMSGETEGLRRLQHGSDMSYIECSNLVDRTACGLGKFAKVFKLRVYNYLPDREILAGYVYRSVTGESRPLGDGM
jgi:hypothetical protein